MKLPRFARPSLPPLLVAVLACAFVEGCGPPDDDDDDDEPVATTSQALNEQLLQYSPEEVAPRPTRNCAPSESGGYRCTNTFSTFFGGATRFPLYKNLQAISNQRLELTNVGETAITAYVDQPFVASGEGVRVAPGQTVVLARRSANVRTFDVVMATEQAIGTAAVDIRRLEGSPADQASLPGFGLRYGNPTSNCAYAGDGAFTCENKTKEWWWGTNDSCKLFDGLSTWSDQKVRITNTGKVDVDAYVTQGFDVHAQETKLKPGESVVLHRIDRGTLSYNVLIRATGEAKVEARPDPVN